MNQNKGIRFSEDIRDAGLLTPYAVESRYPGYWFEITEDDVAEAIQSAEHTVKWAENELKSSQGALL
jgi:HEPN domain-containing protein